MAPSSVRFKGVRPACVFDAVGAMLFLPFGSWGAISGVPSGLGAPLLPSPDVNSDDDDGRSGDGGGSEVSACPATVGGVARGEGIFGCAVGAPGMLVLGPFEAGGSWL